MQEFFRQITQISFFEWSEAFPSFKEICVICITNREVLFWQDYGPGRTKFSSRGRAALREAHGKMRANIGP